MTNYRDVSLWLDRYAGSLDPRPPLVGDSRCDIAIVGAGFTGLWTAYYLLQADPTLRIVILEKEIAGFGASGRNGGWCSALFPTSWQRIATESGVGAATAMRDAMRGAIDAVEAASIAEGIDCDFHRGGTVALAFGAAQVSRAQSEVSPGGVYDDDLRWLDTSQLADIASAPAALGATFTPHCAVIDPAKLVRGLADAVVRLGADLREQTAVTSISPHLVVTDRGIVTADAVIRCTEAFSVGLPGLGRSVAPVYSLIVATEPLSEKQLASWGFEDRATFADFGHVICYGQRTADGRIVFGGRGAPYHFGSTIRPEHDRDAGVFAHLKRQLVEMFPQLAGVRFTHEWGGAVAAPRDWHASVTFDRATGLGAAGGYVGDGVSTTNLAGRTLADLALGRSTDLTALPWVGHRSRRWEPEPLRYLGINAGIAVFTAADRSEARTGRPSKLGALAGRFLGG